MNIADTNYVLAFGALVAQIVALALLAVYFLRQRDGFRDVADMFGRWGMWAAITAILVTAVLNHSYERLGIEPCPLCWWQRIFLYPQFVLLSMALWKDRYRSAAIDFSIVLSVIGAGIALYQHALQMLPGSGLPCPATGPSCAARIVFEFGYITYPLMAFSLFAFLIVVMLFVRRRVQQTPQGTF